MLRRVLSHLSPRFDPILQAKSRLPERLHPLVADFEKMIAAARNVKGATLDSSTHEPLDKWLIEKCFLPAESRWQGMLTFNVVNPNSPTFRTSLANFTNPNTLDPKRLTAGEELRDLAKALLAVLDSRRTRADKRNSDTPYYRIRQTLTSIITDSECVIANLRTRATIATCSGSGTQTPDGFENTNAKGCGVRFTSTSKGS